VLAAGTAAAGASLGALLEESGSWQGGRMHRGGERQRARAGRLTIWTADLA
jgi:hypothetical protein